MYSRFLFRIQLLKVSSTAGNCNRSYFGVVFCRKIKKTLDKTKSKVYNDVRLNGSPYFLDCREGLYAVSVLSRIYDILTAVYDSFAQEMVRRTPPLYGHLGVCREQELKNRVEPWDLSHPEGIILLLCLGVFLFSPGSERNGNFYVQDQI